MLFIEVLGGPPHQAIHRLAVNDMVLELIYERVIMEKAKES